jgi:hypothetical protein
VHVPRAQGEITIDGLAGEPSWASAATMPEFAAAEGSREPNGKTTAKLLWDDENLYVYASILDTDIYSEFTQQDDPLWKADCVEVFIDADGNRSGYVELQVSPNNVTFDSWFAGPRSSRGDEAWDSGMRTAVKVSGTGNVKNDGDRGWEVEIAIPLAAVKGRADAMQVAIPPAVGDRWRMNVVRVDRQSKGEIASVSSWNQIGMSDFHALDRMLTVVFADATGSILPAQPAAPGGGESGSVAPSATQGSAAPAQGSAAPSQGSAAPAQGSAAPTPSQGSAAPKLPGAAAPGTAAGSGSGR